MGKGMGGTPISGTQGLQNPGRRFGRLALFSLLTVISTTFGGCLSLFDSGGNNTSDDSTQQRPDNDVASGLDSKDSDLGLDTVANSDTAANPETADGDAEDSSSDLTVPDVPSQCTGNLECDDGVECTQDLCDLQGLCSHVPNDAVCGNSSTCVVFTCQPTTGCRQQEVVGPCDDGDPCTAQDSCSGGVCQGTPAWTAECNYAQAPNVATCKQGSLSEATKAEALELVNEFRQLSGLEPVPYLGEGDVQTQAAALMMAANASLNHTPPNSWFCWTQAGYDGAYSGNLFIWGSSVPADALHPIEALLGFLIDDGVPSLGHRRWVLDPFLPGISYGSVHGTALEDTAYPYVSASALKVIYNYDADVATSTLEYVAYPVNDYPSAYFQNDWYLSFSALVDPTDRWGNKNVSYASATIKVTGPNNTNMAVSSISWNNEGMGVPNHVQWKVANLQDGVTYTVNIDNVKNGSQTLTYQYWFRLE